MPRHLVQQAAAGLAGHHSASTLPQRATAFLQATMSWQCSSCRQWAKATASFCPQCGTARQSYTAHGPSTPWQKGQDYGDGYQTWSQPGQHSGAWDRRPKSPRGWSPRRRGGGKGKQPGNTPQKGRGRATQPTAKGEPVDNTPVPPSVAGLPSVPAAPAIPQPKPGQATSTSAQSPSAEKMLLESLLHHLGGKEDLPPELAAMMGQYRQDTHRTQAKEAHRLVTRQQEAKQALAKVRTERGAYESTWSSYLADLTQLLGKQFAERSQAMEIFNEAEDDWRQRLQETSQQLARHAGLPAAEAGEAIDVEAMDDEEIMVDNQAAEDAKLQAAREAARAQAKEQEARLVGALQQVMSTLPAREREGSRTPRRRSSKTATESEQQEEAPRQDAKDDAAAKAAQTTTGGAASKASPPGGART